MNPRKNLSKKTNEKIILRKKGKGKKRETFMKVRFRFNTTQRSVLVDKKIKSLPLAFFAGINLENFGKQGFVHKFCDIHKKINTSNPKFKIKMLLTLPSSIMMNK